MKSVPRITKVQLKVNPSDELSLIGIVSAEPDYKLSLAINRKLKIALKNNEPLKINDDGLEFSFSRFTYHDEDSELTCNLISNRSGMNVLLKTIKNVDFILQIHHPEAGSMEASRLFNSIRDIQGVTAVFNLQTNSMKDKNIRYLTL